MRIISITSALVLLLLGSNAFADPVQVQVVSPDGTITQGEYQAPVKATRAWRIGIAIPHLKDPYWLAAAYGAMTEAERLGIQAKLVAAQGYTDVTGQLNQLDNLVVEGVDAIVLAAVGPHAQSQKVSKIVENGTPVIGMINPIETDAVKVRRGISYKVLAEKAGGYFAESIGTSSVKVALLPGPAGSGWAEDLDSGFQSAIRDHANIEVIDTKFGDTGKDAQMMLLQNILQAHPEVDYIVGNPVAAEAAPNLLATLGNTKTKVVSLIATPPVMNLVERDKVLMFPSDQAALLARLAVDAAVDVLEKRDVPGNMGAAVTIVTKRNVSTFDRAGTFAPEGYRPVFQVNWQ